MTTLTQASRQWASRPSDERFTSLYEMGAKLAHTRSMSRAPVVSSRKIEVQPHALDPKRGIQVVGPAGNAVVPSHWAFGQLASLAGAPAGYLRKLPAPVVADCMNYGLRFDRDVEDIGLLLTKETDQVSMKAATGPKYGRIWNSDIIEALVEHHGDGRTGKFRVPGEFGKQVEVTKANTTLFASDRDMFVFLADEENRIEMKDRRGGRNGSLARGFFLWNSEVGSSSLGAAFFLFDYTCSNRIVWGAQDVREIRLRHTVSAPSRWIEEIEPVLMDYANSATRGVTETIAEAQRKRVDDDLDAFLAKRFNGAQVKGIKEAHMVEEGRPIETLWDAVTGATAFAKTIEHQDNRVAMERLGGQMLEMVRAR